MTNPFTYYTPTKVVFGRDTEMQAGALVKEEGCKKVLIHYGGGSAKRSGLLDRIESSLKGAGIAYVMLGGVKPNPRLSLVHEGIKMRVLISCWPLAAEVLLILQRLSAMV